MTEVEGEPGPFPKRKFAINVLIASDQTKSRDDGNSSISKNGRRNEYGAPSYGLSAIKLRASESTNIDIPATRELRPPIVFGCLNQIQIPTARKNAPRPAEIVNIEVTRIKDKAIQQSLLFNQFLPKAPIRNINATFRKLQNMLAKTKVELSRG